MAQDLKDRGCSVSFILYPLEMDWRYSLPQEAYREMKESWDDFHVVIPTIPYHQRAVHDDHGLDDWWDPALESFLWWYLQANRFDALIVNYIYLSKALTLAPKGTVRILDTHDKFAGRREQLVSLGLEPEFFHLSEAEEARGIHRADMVLAIKPEEEEYFRRLNARRVISVPFSEGIKDIGKASPGERDGYLRIGLIGGRNNINKRSVETFLDAALPRFREMLCPIEVVLAGTMCADLQSYSNHSNVKLLGPVGDVAQFYEQIDAAVVPMRNSTGQKIKVGEAIGFGVPVIATGHAFEGYEPTHDYHRCKSLTEVIESCVKLSFQQSKLPALAEASRKSALAQERMVERNTDKLMRFIGHGGQRGVVLIDGKRFIASPLFRDHVLQITQFLSSILNIRVIVNYKGKRKQETVEAKQALDNLRRYCVTVQWDRFDEDDLSRTLKKTDTAVFVNYDPDFTGLEKVMPDWEGLILDNSVYSPLSSQQASFPPFEPGTTFNAVYGIHSQQKGIKGPVMGDTTWLPCRNYSDTSSPDKFGQGVFVGKNAALIFAESESDFELVQCILNEIVESRSLDTVIIATEAGKLFKRLEDDASARHGLRLKLVHQSQSGEPVLNYTPRMIVDLAPFSGSTSEYKIASLEMKIPRIRRRAPIVNAGRIIDAGVSGYDVLVWVTDCLKHDLYNYTHPVKRCDGYAALYSDLKQRLDLRGVRV
ncbi:glycosyltransferase [Henriciella mobilis]|uniref:Glycosyltransferase n=2 Tax=Henriciella mobilis TaxID=2305467 RepID=A0A399RQ19_9PROT|nr:glycosyltransferase [Henriciella mobilis]